MKKEASGRRTKSISLIKKNQAKEARRLLDGSNDEKRVGSKK